MRSRRGYAALAALQAGDAVASAIPLPPIEKSLDSLGVPAGIRWVFPTVKAASAVGLLAGHRYPPLARLTTALLTLYFVLAVGAHLRVRDRLVNTVPAAGLLVLFGVLTVKGPDTR
ncbi:DoxX family protein [Mycolicibacterium sp. S2-37]|nr:DoxX family protein [Mycolicibacterium sp. S2-37]